jgi:CTP:molybdopterin cytidylyltransferase MocA
MQEQEPIRIAAVILAAGASSRFGSPKQVAQIGDRTMLEAVIKLARQAELAPIIAVVPPGLAVPADVVPVVNDAPRDGLSRSLRLGLRAVPPEVEGALILLGDQPTLERGAIGAVLHAPRGGRPVIAARAEGRLAPPILVLRDAFGLADEAVGDAGLGPVLAAHPELVAAVDVGRHAPDVDIPADLARLW